MPDCIKCHCHLEKGDQICPWCGTHQRKGANYRKWLLPFTAFITLSSIGITLTFPLIWDGLFHLGFHQPLLNLDRLEQLLKAEEWEQADHETSVLLNQATQPNSVASSESLAWNQIKQLSCADLQAINQLWLSYSQGRFGFSIQRKIYDETTVHIAEPHPLETPLVDSSSHRRGSNTASSTLQAISDGLALEFDRQRAFRDRIGWGWLDNKTTQVASNDPRIHFRLTAPIGHLPSSGVFIFPSFRTVPIFSSEAFAKRQEQCGL